MTGTTPRDQGDMTGERWVKADYLSALTAGVLLLICVILYDVLCRQGAYPSVFARGGAVPAAPFPHISLQGGLKTGEAGEICTPNLLISSQATCYSSTASCSSQAPWTQTEAALCFDRRGRLYLLLVLERHVIRIEIDIVIVTASPAQPTEVSE